MTDEKKKIIGYRDLTESEISLINEIKMEANRIGELVDKVIKLDDIDKRWASIARTELQQGVMALIRAVANPETF